MSNDTSTKGYPEYGNFQGRLWDDEQLKREQTRGAFVIGSIAFILALLKYQKDIPQFLASIDIPNSLDLPFKGIPQTLFIPISYILLMWWGLYILLIVVAVSDDVITDCIWSIYAKLYEKHLCDKDKVTSAVSNTKSALFIVKKRAHQAFFVGIALSYVYLTTLIVIVFTVPWVGLQPR